jgi:UDP-glucose 4-epimerase
VTGGAGFVGSHLVDALVARGESVVVLDDLSTGRIENLQPLDRSDQVRFVPGSVLDAGLVEQCMADAHVCLHLASAVGVRLVMDHPLEALLSNVQGAQTVLASAARLRRRVIFTSTSEIYGKNSVDGLQEDADRVFGSSRKARWGYALSKSVGEFIGYQLHREHDADVVIVRLFNTVGPRQRSAYGMVIPRFVKQALAGDNLTVYGDGTQSRCFLHVADAVEGILGVCNSEPASGRIMNLGTRAEISIIELARRIIEYTGSRSMIDLVGFEEAFGDGFEELGRRIPDTSAIQDLTGWRPSRTLDDAIADVVAYERSTILAEPLPA